MVVSPLPLFGHPLQTQTGGRKFCESSRPLEPRAPRGLGRAARATAHNVRRRCGATDTRRRGFVDTSAITRRPRALFVREPNRALRCLAVMARVRARSRSCARSPAPPELPARAVGRSLGPVRRAARRRPRRALDSRARRCADRRGRVGPAVVGHADGRWESFVRIGVEQMFAPCRWPIVAHLRLCPSRNRVHRGCRGAPSARRDDREYLKVFREAHEAGGDVAAAEC